jgi:hypothetical protein
MTPVGLEGSVEMANSGVSVLPIASTLLDELIEEFQRIAVDIEH